MTDVKLIAAGDEPILRKGLESIVRGRNGWSVAAEAGDAAELLEALQRDSFDAALVVVPLGEKSGIELVEQIRVYAPSLPLIILAAYREEHYALSFLRAGANAFLPRNADADQLLDAIAAAAGGGKYMSRRLAAAIAPHSGHRGRPSQPHERLSTRELEVFQLLAAGQSPTAIANLLALSVKTVSTYRARILEKTGFRSNAEIVGYAIRHRMV